MPKRGGSPSCSAGIRRSSSSPYSTRCGASTAATRAAGRCWELLPTEAPNVVLGPGEDAGIIRFARRKTVTGTASSSPMRATTTLPAASFEGAATGIGGIVRDVYCMGADVVGVLDPLRFGDPEGPKGRQSIAIARGVVEGIAGTAIRSVCPIWGRYCLRRRIRRELPGQCRRGRNRQGIEDPPFQGAGMRGQAL